MKTTLAVMASTAALLLSMTATGADSGKSVSLNGYVIDSACAFTKNLDKPISRDCAVACAKAGSPLVLLSDDKHVYWPISEKTPAEGQNAKLMEFAGKHVSVSGQVYERGGSKAIVIQKISSSK